MPAGGGEKVSVSVRAAADSADQGPPHRAGLVPPAWSRSAACHRPVAGGNLNSNQIKCTQKQIHGQSLQKHVYFRPKFYS